MEGISIFQAKAIQNNKTFRTGLLQSIYKKLKCDRDHRPFSIQIVKRTGKLTERGTWLPGFHRRSRGIHFRYDTIALG